VVATLSTSLSLVEVALGVLLATVLPVVAVVAAS
jgi:hypothetical protein